MKNGKNDTLCKKRYSQIAITALGNLTTSSARILQSDGSTTTYSMELTIGAEDFGNNSSSAKSILLSAVSLAVMTLALVFA